MIGSSYNTKLSPDSISAPSRKFSAKETKARHEKGLYYYCDERFTPGPRLKKMRIYIIEEFEDMNNMEDAIEGDVAPLKCILIGCKEDTARLNREVGRCKDIGPAHNLAQAP